MTIFSALANDEDLAYWDARGVEVCSHVRAKTRTGYCLGPLCRPCLWKKAGVDPNKIKAYEDWEDAHTPRTVTIPLGENQL